ncbi:hypothetical protein KKB40_03430, partial [Patescibacteria group bacterium]|nr:hypothetical protein [Patescibacteria group bacterium]
MKKKRDFLSHLLIFVLIIIPLILVAIWFKDGKMIAGAEEGLLLYNPKRSVNLLKYAWMKLGTGNINVVYLPSLTFLFFTAKLQSLGLPVFLIQAITFYCLMTISLISTYFLLTALLDEFKIASLSESSKKILALLASLYYLLNPYSIFSVWQRFLYPLFFLQALLPLGLLLFTFGLKKRRLYFTALLCLSSFLLSEAFGIPIFFITFSSALFIYSVAVILVHRKNSEFIKFTILYFLLTIFFLVFTNSWWLLFLYKTGPIAFESYSSTELNLSILMGVAQNLGLINVMRLIDLTPGFNQKLWGGIYSSLLFQIVSFVPLIVVLTTLIKQGSLKLVRLLSIILLFSFFVANGASFPFGKIFIFFFKRIQFLQSFRNPFEKYGMVLSLTFSLLFGVGIIYFYTLLKTKWGKTRSIFALIILLFMLFIVYPFPMWKGSVFGGIKNNYRVNVPEYYEEVYKTIGTGEERIIELPFITQGGVRMLWPNKYQGGIISKNIFPRETLSGKTKTPFTDQLIPSMWENFYTGDFWKTMHLTGSKYLLLHHDMDNEKSNTDSPENIKSHLENFYKPGKPVEINLCPNWESYHVDEEGKITLRCKIASENTNWSNFRFLHLELESANYAEVWFHVESDKRETVWWNELPETRCEIESNEDTNKFTLNLQATKARFPKFKYDNLNYFYVNFDTQSKKSEKSDFKVENISRS